MTDDAREDEVADLAKRAAHAASERRRRRRSGGGRPADDADPVQMERIGAALEKIRQSCTLFDGALIVRGVETLPLVSLLPDEDPEAARRLLTRAATTTRTAVDYFADAPLGEFVDQMISTERGAVLTKRIGDDLLLVATVGYPPDVAPVWRAIVDVHAEIGDAAKRLFGPEH